MGFIRNLFGGKSISKDVSKDVSQAEDHFLKGAELAKKQKWQEAIIN